VIAASALIRPLEWIVAPATIGRLLGRACLIRHSRYV
jgi:hypothetical protein